MLWLKILEKIIKFLLSDSDIASFIENPSVKNTNKLSVLNVASDKLELSKLTKDFIGVVTKKGRISNIREIISSFKDLVADMHGIKNAKVSSAKKLSDTQEDQIKQKLKEKYNYDCCNYCSILMRTAFLISITHRVPVIFFFKITAFSDRVLSSFCFHNMIILRVL